MRRILLLTLLLSGLVGCDDGDGQNRPDGAGDDTSALSDGQSGDTLDQVDNDQSDDARDSTTVDASDVSSDTRPTDTASTDTSNQDTLPGDTANLDTVVGDTAPTDTTSTDTSPDAPTAPSALSATPTSSSSIALAWSASTPGTGRQIAAYHIERDGASLTSVTAIAHDDGALAAGTPYCYVVIAEDDAGAMSAPSNEACATTPLPPETVLLVAGGGNHTCAVRADGTTWCWGANNARQLGASVVGDQTQPAIIASLTGLNELALGYEFSCGANDSGSAWCWGANSTGQLGNGTSATAWTPEPVVFPTLDRIAHPRMGHWHSCALDASADVWCWGFNRDGPLGIGVVDTDDHPDALQVTAVSGATQVSLGDFHTCALLADQTVQCWGSNGWGELGRGTFSADPSPDPAAVSGLTDATLLALGHQFSCAVQSGRTLACWGSNGSGQLGQGDTSAEFAPATVAGITDVVDVKAGRKHVCALRADGTLWCWGRNTNGQIGDGTTDDRTVPTHVTALAGVRAFGLGDNHTCAVGDDLALYCWGNNARGQLGEGSLAEQSVPTPVAWPVP